MVREVKKKPECEYEYEYEYEYEWKQKAIGVLILGERNLEKDTSFLTWLWIYCEKVILCNLCNFNHPNVTSDWKLHGNGFYTNMY
jgi:hypothetical protein